MSQSFDYSQSTIEYYNKNALSYYEQTVNIDMSDIYKSFLELIPKGGHILDAGCGSGRDTKEFLYRGYKVTAIDASEAMVELSSQLTGQKTLQMAFQDLTFEKQFDGIWACASLLHIPCIQLSQVFHRFICALRPSGIWYMSFKVGQGQEIIDGRLFNSYDLESIKELTNNYYEIEEIKTWYTLGKIEKISREKWVNHIIKILAL